MIDDNKVYNYFVAKRDNYFFSILSAIASGFFIGFAFILSLGFFKYSEPYINYLVSVLILTLFFFLVNRLAYHHFFQYSVASYLFYKRRLRFSLFFYRILGIWFFNLLGIFIFLILFYYSGLWKVGNSISLLASRIGIYSLKFFDIKPLELFINSLLTGIIGGYVFYSIFNKKSHIQFAGLLLFSFVILTSNFRYNLFDFFNLVFTLIIKKQFLELGLKKYALLNFYDFFFKYLNVFLGNFIGVVFVFIPIQTFINKFKNKDNF